MAGADLLRITEPGSRAGPVRQLRPLLPWGAVKGGGEERRRWPPSLTVFSSPPLWVPTTCGPCSGHCYYQTVVTPVIEQILPDSPGSRLPHTVTLVSIPASAHGKRGLSVSIDPPHGPPGCSTEHSHTVRVQG